MSKESNIDKVNLIGINNFVKRQDELSRFTHYDGTWDMLAILTATHFLEGNSKPGYRPGVKKVVVPAVGFYMKGPFKVGSKITAEFAPRAKGEEPVLQITNWDPKVPCKYVEVIIYRHDVLAEDNDRSTDCVWEIVSINGMQEPEENQPIPPVTMARNFLHKEGGTQASYTAEEFAESIWYWKNKER